MSDTIVEIVSVEASTLTVEVVMPPPAAVVVEVVDFAGPPIGYPQLPEELRQLPISFPFSSRPGQGLMVNVPMGFTVTVPIGLVGTKTYADIPPQAPAVFLLNRVSGAVSYPLGTITIMPGGHHDNVLAGLGGSVPVGEVMQIVAPETQDIDLSDIGITIMVNRV
jgi:hypothetical protein